MTIGPKLAEGREAEVYAWNGNAAVLKLYRPGYSGYLAEAAALASLDSAGVAPRLIEAADVDGRHGLVLQRLDGQDMLTLLQQRPWGLPRFATTLAQAQARIHRMQAPADLPDLGAVLTARIEALDLEKRLRDFALRTLGTLPAGSRLCHGDFHPGNVLVTAGGASVIDWTNATRGAPEADFARTLLLLTQADPLPGTPLLFRGLMAVGRTTFAKIFARSYRRLMSEPARRTHSWTIVQAAARLAEGIAVEEPRLVALLRKAAGASAHADNRRAPRHPRSSR